MMDSPSRQACSISLRPATMDDAQQLYEWRMDQQTQAASLNGDGFSFDHHCCWLHSSLTNPQRRLFIGLRDGLPVGMVRADRDGPGWLLSWSVAPAARGQGVGRPLVAALMACVGGPVHAQVKRDNLPSLRIAEGVGLVPKNPHAQLVDFFSADWQA